MYWLKSFSLSDCGRSYTMYLLAFIKIKACSVFIFILSLFKNFLEVDVCILYKCYEKLAIKLN